jgi:hypothetical protein
MFQTILFQCQRIKTKQPFSLLSSTSPTAYLNTQLPSSLNTPTHVATYSSSKQGYIIHIKIFS